MTAKSILNLKSLKEQVYEYLRQQMHNGELHPGAVIHTERTSKILGISRTPLRDALLQLEMEGFVTIMPRSGVRVNELTLRDIKNSYEIIGALESAAVAAAFPKLKIVHIRKMQEFNDRMRAAIDENDFSAYYRYNLAFHHVYLDLDGNERLTKIVENHKKRLYDFPRQQGFVKRWEEASIGEHQLLIDLIERRRIEEAAQYIRDVHWSYKVQEKYIREYYQQARSINEIGEK